MHHVCIAGISIDSIMKTEKKNYQVYLEERKYEIKKKKMSKFIDNKLELGSDAE